MILTGSTYALAPSISSPFSASGGTPPYTYSVNPGGAGGTIDASTGLYAAPNQISSDPFKTYDTITATDSLSVTATAQVFIGTPLFLVCDILQQELGLPAGSVYLWDQKINIPKDGGLYIAVGVASCKPFGVSTDYDSSGPGLDAVQSVNMMATLDINILSRSSIARDRKEEIVLALSSVYAEQQQELNSFMIGRLTKSFVNLSEEDGAAIPYRFVISVNIQYAYRKTAAAQYFDDFSDVDVVTEP